MRVSLTTTQFDVAWCSSKRRRANLKMIWRKAAKSRGLRLEAAEHDERCDVNGGVAMPLLVGPGFFNITQTLELLQPGLSILCCAGMIDEKSSEMQ